MNVEKNLSLKFVSGSPSSSSLSLFYHSKISLRFFQQFPFDIWFLLQSYLCYYDYRQFLNTNKLHFKEVKFKTVYYNLNLQSSLKFIQIESFQKMILEKIENKFFQLSLYLSFDIYDIKSRYFYYPHIINGLHAVTVTSLQFATMLSSLKNIFILHLENNHDLLSFPYLDNIKILTIKKFRFLQDIQHLSHLKHLELISCPLIHDIQAVENVENLLFEDCPLLTTLAPLTGTKELSIIRCPGIKNIDENNFHGIEKLVIKDCPNILTINNDGFRFDSLKSLTLIQCPNLYDINKMKNIESLIIENCPSLLLLDCCEEISSIVVHNSVYGINYGSSHGSNHGSGHGRNSGGILPIFPRLQRITLKNSKIPSIRHFQYCIAVKLISLSNIDDVSCLKNIEKLHLESCINIHNISMLGNVSMLTIINCPNITSLKGLGRSNQKRVKIDSCHQITNFTPLKTVKMIEISKCTQKIDVSAFESAEIILLQDCEDIINFHKLSHRKYHNLFVLKLIHCPNINSIRGLSKIPIIEIKRCPNLIDFTTKLENESEEEYDGREAENEGMEGKERSQNVKPQSRMGFFQRLRRNKSSNTIDESKNPSSCSIVAKRKLRMEEIIIYEGFPYIHTIKILHKMV